MCAYLDGALHLHIAHHFMRGQFGEPVRLAPQRHRRHVQKLRCGRALTGIDLDHSAEHLHQVLRVHLGQCRVLAGLHLFQEDDKEMRQMFLKNTKTSTRILELNLQGDGHA